MIDIGIQCDMWFGKALPFVSRFSVNPLVRDRDNRERKTIERSRKEVILDGIYFYSDASFGARALFSIHDFISHFSLSDLLSDNHSHCEMRSRGE